MSRIVVALVAFACVGCGGPKSKGENCIYSHAAGTCSQMCRNTYEHNLDKVLACQKGVREEVARKQRVDEAFGGKN